MSKRKTAAESLENATTVATDVELQDERAKRRGAERRYQDALDKVGALERQVDLLLGMQGKPARARYERTKKTRSTGTAAIVPATDWHLGECVDPDTVSGVNEYNLTVAERRIKRYYQKVVELIDFASSLAKISEVWHPLLGDLISGYIHEELQESNDLSPGEACLCFQEFVCSGIDFIRRETKLPMYVPCCFGNHGRTTKRPRHSTGYKNSFEWMTYMMTAKLYSNDPNVTWIVGKGYHNIVDIMKHRVRFHHGDDIRYQGGIGGISIPVNKAIAAWNKGDAANRADLDIFGHWHQFLVHYPSWYSCGTTMGYNAYALSIKAERQRPTQLFLALDRVQGPTLPIPIFVEAGK